MIGWQSYFLTGYLRVYVWGGGLAGLVLPIYRGPGGRVALSGGHLLGRLGVGAILSANAPFGLGGELEKKRLGSSYQDFNNMARGSDGEEAEKMVSWPKVNLTSKTRTSPLWMINGGWDK